MHTIPDNVDYANKVLLITGGGSGGHLNAAIAVIKELFESGRINKEQILFVGGERGMIGDSEKSIESRKIPELSIDFVSIRSGKLHRKFNFTTLKLLFGVIGGFIDSWKLFRKYKGSVVFSTGGYVTVPVVIVARIFRRKIFIHEQTVVSGLANRIAAKFSQKVFVSFPSSLSDFPKSKVELTGAPLQESRFTESIPAGLPNNYSEFLHNCKKSSKPFIFITGGGLGSHVINKWVLDNIGDLARDFIVLLQTGSNKIHNDSTRFNSILLEHKEIRDSFFVIEWYGEEIGFILANVDLVLARPGANTVLELLATERRAVFIPIPWSSGNEQQKNAEYFLKLQSGAIVDQDKINSHLYNEIRRVLNSEPRKSAGQVPHNAANIIARKITDALKP